MEAKTKFNISEYLYTIHENRIVEVKVEEIKIVITEHFDNIFYKVFSFEHDMKETFTVGEYDLFKTKEELIKELIRRS